MVIALPWVDLPVDPRADADISGDSGSAFSMHGGMTVVDGLCNLMPRSLSISVEQPDGRELQMEEIYLDLFRNRLMDRQRFNPWKTTHQAYCN